MVTNQSIWELEKRLGISIEVKTNLVDGLTSCIARLRVEVNGKSYSTQGNGDNASAASHHAFIQLERILQREYTPTPA